MKKQDIALWRGKSVAELAAEIKRRRHDQIASENGHARLDNRRDIARLLTILSEKRTYQSDNQHE